MVDKIENLAHAKSKIAVLERELLDAQERIKVLEGVVHTFENSDTFGDLVKEVERLKKRELELLQYNNEQVEKRREVSAEVDKLRNKD